MYNIKGHKIVPYAIIGFEKDKEILEYESLYITQLHIQWKTVQELWRGVESQLPMKKYGFSSAQIFRHENASPFLAGVLVKNGLCNTIIRKKYGLIPEEDSYIQINYYAQDPKGISYFDFSRFFSGKINLIQHQYHQHDVIETTVFPGFIERNNHGRTFEI